MTDTHTTTRPSFIDFDVDLGAHPGAPWEGWWLASTVRGAGRNWGVQVMATLVEDETLVITTSVSDLDAGTTTGKSAPIENGEFDVATGRLDISSSRAALSIDDDGDIRVTGTVTEDITFELTIRQTLPVVLNGGAASFPFGDGRTWQYSLPALAVTGTLTTAGDTFAVEGRGWFDRQWCDLPLSKMAALSFTWMGLCLDNDDTLSIWDFTPSNPERGAFATIVHPNGTHEIVPVEPVERAASDRRAATSGNNYPGRWRVSVPSRAIELEVTHTELFSRQSRPLYVGALSVTGSANGLPVSGYGFCDLVGWVAD